MINSAFLKILVLMFGITSIQHEYFFVLENNNTTISAAAFRQAAVEINQYVPCVHIQELFVDRIGPNIPTDSPVIFVSITDHLQENHIGQTIPSVNMIILAKNYRDKSPVSKEMLKKISLHELAHLLGMPGSPHPFGDQKTSIFAAIIDEDTPDIMFNEDVLYLNKLVCGS